MTFLYRALKRLPLLWQYRREVWQIIRDTGSATVDAGGIVWIPTSSVERRCVAAMLKNVCREQQQAKGWHWHNACIAFARRLEMSDVATRGEVVEARRGQAPLGI